MSDKYTNDKKQKVLIKIEQPNKSCALVKKYKLMQPQQKDEYSSRLNKRNSINSSYPT